MSGNNKRWNPFYRLKDLAYQKIDSYIDNSNKCLIYKYIPKQRNL